jgi:excisionase family DNA binding protein
MARIAALDEAPSEKEERRSETKVPSLLSPSAAEGLLSSLPHGIEVLLTTKEASQILKIHPKVLERMAKRGEVPALKVGKLWRYRATTLDAWINSRLQSARQPSRMETSF